MTVRMSTKEYQALVAKKPGRYPSVKKTEANGITVDSGHAKDRHIELLWLERGGVIRDLRLQVPYPIVIGGVRVTYDSGRQMSYVADFVYFDIENQCTVIEDAKGHRNKEFKMKKALMKAMGLEIIET